MSTQSASSPEEICVGTHENHTAVGSASLRSRASYISEPVRRPGLAHRTTGRLQKVSHFFEPQFPCLKMGMIKTIFGGYHENQMRYAD